MQRLRDPGTLSPKLDASIRYPRALGTLEKGLENMEDTNKTRPANKPDQYTYELTETEAACTDKRPVPDGV